MLYFFLCVIPRRLNFMCRCFGTHCSNFIGCLFLLHRTWTTYEDGIDRGFRNVGTENSDAGKSPKRKNTALKTRRKLEIKKSSVPLHVVHNMHRKLWPLLNSSTVTFSHNQYLGTGQIPYLSYLPRKRRDLQSVVPHCYVSIVNFFFGLSSFFI